MKKTKSLKGIKSKNKVELDFKYQKLKDIPSDASIRHCYSLDVSFNNIKTFVTLSREIGSDEKYQNLTIVHASCNYITSIKGIEKCPKLEILHLQSNMINNIKPVSNLRKLRVLELENNEINDISPLKNLVKLEILNLNYNFVWEIKALSKLSNLREIHLCRNKLDQSTSFRDLTCKNVTEIDVSQNHLTKFVIYRFMMKLRVLKLEKCKLTSVVNWKRAPKLFDLNIANNKIASLSKLGKICPLLDSLDIRNNNISKIEDVVSCAKKLRTLCILRVAGNPCCHDMEYKKKLLMKLPHLSMVDDLEQDENVALSNARGDNMSIVDEFNLDLSLGIDALEKQFMAKLKQKMKMEKKKKTGRRGKKRGRKNFQPNTNVNNNIPAAKTMIRKSPNPIIHKPTRNELLMDAEKKKQTEMQHVEVTRLYEECRRAATDVQKKIDLIVADFSTTYEDKWNPPANSRGVADNSALSQSMELAHDVDEISFATTPAKSSKPLFTPVVSKIRIPPSNVVDTEPVTIQGEDIDLQRPRSSYEKIVSLRKQQKQKKTMKAKRPLTSRFIAASKIISTSPRQETALKRAQDAREFKNRLYQLSKKHNIPRFNSSEMLFKELNIHSYNTQKKKRRKAIKKRIKSRLSSSGKNLAARKTIGSRYKVKRPGKKNQ